jgi:hypothetical protein
VPKRIAVAVMATLALGLLPATSAGAADDAEGSLREFPGHERLGDFYFNPRGERMLVNDRQKNGWGILVELWWGGELRRWCWNTKGFGDFQECNFSIPEGRNISFFVAEFDGRATRLGPRARREALRRGEGKRLHVWAGAGEPDGCRVSGWREPCGYGAGDFRGEA